MNRRLFSGSKFNRDRRADSFARAVIAEAERRRRLEVLRSNTEDPERCLMEAPARVYPTDESVAQQDLPLGACPHCGSAYHDERERQYHADAECVGGAERFR